MKFNRPLIPARLRRRYKRFLADVTLENGKEVTAHCPNPGSMLGLAVPGARVWVEPNDDPRRKLRYSWRLVEITDGHFVGIDTSLPNRLIARNLRSRMLPEFAAYGNVRTEVPCGRSSRIDFLLTEPELPDAWVEVKNVTLSREEGWAEFPDSVTARGTRHLVDLAAMAWDRRAIMLYLVQRMDCSKFRLAADIDRAYSRAYDEARDSGVEMVCYDTRISTRRIRIGKRLPIFPDPVRSTQDLPNCRKQAMT